MKSVFDVANFAGVIRCHDRCDMATLLRVKAQRSGRYGLKLSASEREIVVGYEDAAPAHDSFDRIVPPDYSGPAETWRIGGWGIPLIARFAYNLRYEHSGGRNRIHFTLPIDRPKE